MEKQVMFYYPVPDGCIDLGCFTYCNGTGYFPPVPEPSIIIPLLLLIFWCFICLVLVLEGIAISIGFVLYLLNCPTGDDQLPPPPPQRQKITMVVEVWRHDEQKRKRRMKLSPFLLTRQVRKDVLNNFFHGFMDNENVEDYEVILQKEDGTVTTLDLDLTLTDQHAENEGSLIFRHIRFPDEQSSTLAN